MTFKDVRIHSEFAGYGTAELVVESIAAICGEMGFRMGVKRASGDMNSHCQKLLLANSDDGCVFGDILNLLPDAVRDRIAEGIKFEVSVSSTDVQHALTSLQKGTADQLFTSKGRLICKIGEIVDRDMVLVGVPGDTENTPLAMKKLKKLVNAKKYSTKTFVFQRRTRVVKVK